MKYEKGPQSEQHELYVKREIFPYIKSGEKKWEVRIDSEHRKQFNTGDTITFLDGKGGSIEKKVGRVVKAHSFTDFLEEVDSDDVMPGYSYEELISRWEKLYNKKQYEKFGIVAFEIK